jgi:hypothetical protein
MLAAKQRLTSFVVSTAGVDRMTGNGNLLSNPIFRYGQATMSAVLIAAVAFSLVDDTTVRAVMLLVAALDVVVTPQILKRAGEQAAADAGPHDV